MKFKGKNRAFRVYLDLVRGFNAYWLDRPLGDYVHINELGASNEIL